jgi:hypothetical protein
MESVFTAVVFGSVALFFVVGILSMLAHGSAYDEIGQGGLSLHDSHASGPPAPPPNSPAARAEREQEIRQMLQARSERLVRRGQQGLDLDAEVAKLEQPQPATGSAGHEDPGLAEEVRQLVIARNERRVRQGLQVLNVEAEVSRTLQELSPSPDTR